MGAFLWLSDLHVDPFYGTRLAFSHKTGTNCSLPDNATLLDHPYGRVGCDAPPSLLESTLQNAKNAAISQNSDNNIDFVLITGDFSRHSLDALGSDNTFSTNSGNKSTNGANDDDPNSIDPVAYAGSIISDCISSIQAALPNVPIIPVLGNNDVVPDYYLEPDAFDHPSMNWPKPNPRTMLASVTNGLKGSFLSDEEASTFQHGGYFSRLVPLASSSFSSSILVLSINTVLYSINHQPDWIIEETDGREHQIDDPYGQFEWIESQFRIAAVSRLGNGIDLDIIDDVNKLDGTGAVATNHTNIVGIYLAGHIPPSIGSYRHSQLWHDRYLEQYFRILKNYSKGYYNPSKKDSSSINNNSDNSPPPILGHFFGHVHTEEFRLLTYYDSDEILDESEKMKNVSNKGSNNATATTESNGTTAALLVPVLVTSSITPIFGSNPSYRLVQYDDKSGALLDYTTHYLDLNSSDSDFSDTDIGVGTTETQEQAIWIGLPSFVEAYGLPDLSLESFENLVACLEAELHQALTSELKGGNKGNGINSHLWETFWNRQHLYSLASDDGYDDGDEVKTMKMTHWLCIMGSSSKKEYTECVETKRIQVLSGESISCGRGGSDNYTSSFASLFRWGTNTFLVFCGGIGLVVMLMMALCVVWKKRFSARRMYTLPVEIQDTYQQSETKKPSSLTGDGVFVISNSTETDAEEIPELDIEIT